MAATVKNATIDQSFKKFHKDNPQVYRIFKEQVSRALRLGREKVSSRQILGWIRWEVSLDLKTSDVYKINDHYTSRYSRLYIEEHPEHSEIFDFRILKTRKGDKVKKIWDKNLIKILTILNDPKKYVDAYIYKYPNNSLFFSWFGKGKSKADILEITRIQFNKLLRKRYICIDRKMKPVPGLRCQYYTISKTGQKFLEQTKK